MQQLRGGCQGPLRLLLQLGQQGRHIGVGATLQTAVVHRRQAAAGRLFERLLQQGPDRLALLSSHWTEGPLAIVSGMPVGHHRDQFVVQARRTLAEQRQAAQHDQPWLRIAAGHHAGALQLVVQKALGQEAAQQPLHQPVLQVQMHRFGTEAAGIGEDHWPHWVLEAPIAYERLGRLHAPQAVEGGLPAAVAGLAHQRLGIGQVPAGLAALIGVGFQPTHTEKLQRHVQSLAERIVLKGQPLLRFGQQPAQGVLLLLQLPVAGGLQLLSGPLQQGTALVAGGIHALQLPLHHIELIQVDSPLQGLLHLLLHQR